MGVYWKFPILKTFADQGIQTQAITHEIAKFYLTFLQSRAETSKEIDIFNTQKKTLKLQLCWCTLWMLQKKYKTLSCGFSLSFTNVCT